MSFNISSSWSQRAARSERPNTQPSFCLCASVWPPVLLGAAFFFLFSFHIQNLGLVSFCWSRGRPHSQPNSLWAHSGQRTGEWVSWEQGLDFPHGWEESGVGCCTCLLLLMSWLWHLRHACLILYLNDILKCFRMVHPSDYKILSGIITKDSLSKIIMQLKCVRYLFHKIWEIKNKEKTDLSPVILGDSTSITKPHKPKPRCVSQYLLNDRSCRERGLSCVPCSTSYWVRIL